MTQLIRRFHHKVIRPAGETIVLGLQFNRLIWTKYFDAAWEATPLYEKLSWMMLFANTMAILTLFQILTLRP